MKKLLLTTLVAFVAISLNAQISVWDGSAEPWTNGSGTLDDPILIENAQQLAYMSQNAHGWSLKYYKLMTDIDLDNRDWYPIGYSSAPTYTFFSGYFDGNGHTIYHLTTSLFWWMEDGYIKNLTIRDSDIVYKYGSNVFGGLTYTAPLVENCHNYGNVILDYDGYDGRIWRIGGIGGECGTIINCSNHGKLMVNAKPRVGYLKIGGLAGTVYIVEESYNTGEITVDSEISLFCYMGGICGEINRKASCCYNRGNMRDNNYVSYIGGIAGNFKNSSSADSLLLSSCYNTGNIIATNIGGLLAKSDYDGLIITENSFYLNIIESVNEFGTPKPDAEMKSLEFVNLLNINGEFFAMDDLNTNDGYPIFAQYYTVEENEIIRGITIYPNPANSVIYTYLAQDVACQLIEIHSIDGRLLKSQTVNLETIDISNLTPGIYILKVKTTDGKEYTERIVKE